jgi:hypothetical protein
MLAGLKSIRRRLRAPTEDDLDNLLDHESHPEDSVEASRARRRLEDLRQRLGESDTEGSSR